MHFRYFLIIGLCSVGNAVARDNGRYFEAPEHIRQWFNEQVSPDTNRPCCSVADGFETQEKLENGQYWVIIESKWYPVPPSKVIHDKGNPLGHPVVWYMRPPFYEVDSDPLGAPEPTILCFVPGAKT